MHYYRQAGKEFVENGPAKLRVTTMDVRPSPITQGRILRIVVVNEILRKGDKHSIRIGSAIALSFPPEKVNSPEYRWRMEDMSEECQVPIKFKLHQN